MEGRIAGEPVVTMMAFFDEAVDRHAPRRQGLGNFSKIAAPA
jgi:hypothetical protein